MPTYDTMEEAIQDAKDMDEEMLTKICPKDSEPCKKKCMSFIPSEFYKLTSYDMTLMSWNEGSIYVSNRAHCNNPNVRVRSCSLKR